MKVIVGMSGGVDSSTAAYLLKKQGYEVEGLSLVLFETRTGQKAKPPTSCCTLESIEDAARVCARLGIPHRTVNAQAEFMELVMEPFARAYAAGLTPNPCILCNREIKFPFLMRQASEAGADFIATGHYAVLVRRSAPGKILLKKGADPAKDQSYVLYAQKPQELMKLLLPLGGYRKSQVRELAAGAGLAPDRPESQEICFIEGKDYFPLVKELCPGAGNPGPIFNEKSEVIGRHKGICTYTLGQRKGLGIPSAKNPLYVYRIDAAGNAVYAGGRDKCLIRKFTYCGANWITEMRPPFRAAVKVRSMMEAVPGSVGEDSVELDASVWAPAPGQSAVFYEGDMVLGGGIIREVVIK